MRIGVDASCWINQRGYGRFTRELLKAMIASVDSLTNEYVFFIDSVSYQSCDFPLGVKSVSVFTDRAAAQAASSSSYRSPKDMYQMAKAASSEDLDILFFPSIYTFFPTISKAKKVVAIHDVIPEMYPDLIFPTFRSRLFWKIKSEIAINQADSILTVSNYSKQGIIDYLKIEPHKIFVTIEAADSRFRKMSRDEKFQEVLTHHALSIEDQYFLYVGGIGPHKNINALIDGFRLFQNKNGTANTKLVIVGDFENDAFWMDDKIQKRAQLGEEKDKIIFTGHVPDEDLPYFYSGALGLIIPSFSEGFGLPALEAMACGTTVISSETTSLPEIVRDAGLFFDPHKPEQLTVCMERICNDPQLRETFQNRGYKRAQEYSWNAAAQIVLNAFKKLA